MSKHAVEGLTKAMSLELAAHNIRVNTVAPTFVETPMTKTFFDDAAFRDWVMDRLPIGRLLQADEVAYAVCYLASPAAAMITGTSLKIDGGWTAQ
jgi:NAD(P)-dependent dehydrogenase (short-subunit alcohol dehydrogenase family)